MLLVQKKLKKIYAIVRIQGGLGNQMFQYAFSYALSKKCDIKVFLDDFDYHKNVPCRNFELDKFNLEIKTMRSQYKKSFIKKLLREMLLFKLFKQNFNITPNRIRPIKNLYKGGTPLSFDEKVFSIKSNTYFDNFFQSEKYFKDYDADIKEMFTLKNPIDKKNKQILDTIKNTDSISMHIRRGDYTSDSFWGILPKTYYKKGLELILAKNQLKNPKIFIFSDDINWAKENLNFDIETIFVENPETLCTTDLELMKNCKHNIIANSSFSWWGAWLNPNSEKTVIIPRPWFKGIKEDQDIYPENWEKIDWEEE